MTNNLILIGRICEISNLYDNENNQKETIVTLAIPRSLKNEDGVYETDFIKVILKGSIARTTCEYCQKGDLVGIKGRVENLGYGDYLKIVADKVTFLSTRPNDNIETKGGE